MSITNYGNHNSYSDYKKILTGINVISGNNLKDFIDTRATYHAHGKELKQDIHNVLSNVTERVQIDRALSKLTLKLSLNEIIDGAPNSVLYQAMQKATPEASILHLIKNF